jgi:hypothetical protein
MKLPVLLLLTALASAKPVTTTDELTAAAAGAGPGEAIELAEGTFRLAQPLTFQCGVNGEMTVDGWTMDQSR